MNDDEQKELISAYLDDELSAGERAHVETLLASNASLRELLDDLRAIRGAMQSLPRHKLDHDLAPLVVRRAERTVLSGGNEPSAPADVVPASLVAQWWARGGWRRVVWPAAAIAAALAIILFDTTRKSDVTQVAQKMPRETGAMQARDVREEATPAEALAEADKERAGAPAAAPIDSFQREPLRKRAAEEMPREAGQYAAPVPAEQNIAGTVEGAAANRADVDRSPDDGQQKRPLDALAPKPQSPGPTSAPRLAGTSELEFEVDAEFIREQRLEKMLNDKKISFSRVTLSKDEALRERDAFALGLQRATDAVAEEQYRVTATPEQLGEVVAAMEVVTAQRFNRNAARSAMSAASNEGKQLENRPARQNVGQAQGAAGGRGGRAAGRSSTTLEQVGGGQSSRTFPFGTPSAASVVTIRLRPTADVPAASQSDGKAK